LSAISDTFKIGKKFLTQFNLLGHQLIHKNSRSVWGFLVDKGRQKGGMLFIVWRIVIFFKNRRSRIKKPHQ